MNEGIQTTTGTATPEELGRTLIHEHVLVGYPGWELDAKAPRFRRDEAMARAVDGHCAECHVRLRPQHYNEVRRNDTLIQCESCMRILYFDPDAGPESAQAGA